MISLETLTMPRRQIYRTTSERGYLLTKELKTPILSWVLRDLFVFAGHSLKDMARRLDLQLQELEEMANTGNPNWLQQKEQSIAQKMDALIRAVQSDLSIQIQSLSGAQRIRALAVNVEIMECERYFLTHGDFYQRTVDGDVVCDKSGRKMLIRLPDDLLKPQAFQTYFQAILEAREVLHNDRKLLDEQEAGKKESNKIEDLAQRVITGEIMEDE